MYDATINFTISHFTCLNSRRFFQEKHFQICLILCLMMLDFFLWQANEETGNRRPVMISLLDTKKNKSSSKDKTDPPTNNPSQSANKPMASLATAASPPPPPTTTAASSGSSTTSSSAMSVEGVSGPEQSRITLPRYYMRWIIWPFENRLNR